MFCDLITVYKVFELGLRTVLLLLAYKISLILYSWAVSMYGCSHSLFLLKLKFVVSR